MEGRLPQLLYACIYCLYFHMYINKVGERFIVVHMGNNTINKNVRVDSVSCAHNVNLLLIKPTYIFAELP